MPQVYDKDDCSGRLYRQIVRLLAVAWPTLVVLILVVLILLLMLRIRRLLLCGRPSIQRAIVQSLDGHLCGIFSRVVDVLAIVPEARRDDVALHLHRTRPRGATA